jgi:hypothetical protein
MAIGTVMTSACVVFGAVGGQRIDEASATPILPDLIKGDAEFEAVHSAQCPLEPALGLALSQTA